MGKTKDLKSPKALSLTSAPNYLHNNTTYRPRESQGTSGSNLITNTNTNHLKNCHMLASHASSQPLKHHLHGAPSNCGFTALLQACPHESGHMAKAVPAHHGSSS